MSDLICKRTSRRCNTPGMCSPYGGCRNSVGEDKLPSWRNGSLPSTPFDKPTVLKDVDVSYSDSSKPKFEPLELIPECELEDMARIEFETALGFGITLDNFVRLAKTVLARVRKEASKDEEALRNALATMDTLSKDPEAVLVNLMRGSLARPSARALSKLFGDVINGEEAQLMEIARLREENAALKRDRDAQALPKSWEAKGYNGCLSSASEAIRFLLKEGGPSSYGESPYNYAHCIQISNELDKEQKMREAFLADDGQKPTLN